MEADAGFIEHIEHVDQFRPDLCGQPDTLALAAAERARGPAQRKVFQAHILQETDAGDQFFEDIFGDAHLARREMAGQCAHPIVQRADIHLRHFGDVFPVHLEMEGFLLKPGSTTDRTDHFFHKMLLLVLLALALLLVYE